MDRNQAIEKLIAYALEKQLIQPEEKNWAVNTLLEMLELDGCALPEIPSGEQIDLPAVLDALLDDAYERGVLKENSIVYRDLFDTRLMGALTPRPAQVIEKFNTLYRQSPKEATDWYYRFSQDTNYIRRDRIARDVQWKTMTEYGELDITINLSKPEKDPKAIAAARNLPASNYPRCQLCAENEGYAGRVNHPARQNHRIVPITINGSPWFLQYSPYVYYNEHCICLNREHVPMKIDRACFGKLLDFVRQFPHYFVGSNADLPIVGGSILAHDHFQGGHYTFAMEKAPVETPVCFAGFDDVQAGIVKWPMSVIRLNGEDPQRLIDLADRILTSWRSYTDREAMILAETDGEPHNTITPIARRRGECYELDLVLRNNLTTEEHPLGLYHPHAELHHIKKENIGWRKSWRMAATCAPTSGPPPTPTGQKRLPKTTPSPRTTRWRLCRRRPALCLQRFSNMPASTSARRKARKRSCALSNRFNKIPRVAICDPGVFNGAIFLYLRLQSGVNLEP